MPNLPRHATSNPLALVAVLAALALAAIGCGSGPTGGDVLADAPAPDTVVGSAAGQPITWADVQAEAGGSLHRLQQERYDTVRVAMQNIATKRAIEAAAAERNMTPEELVVAEVDQKVVPPTEQEIVEFYDFNRNLARGPLEQYRDLIVRRLTEDRREELAAEFNASMRERASLVSDLQPPRFRVELPEDIPSKGPESAPVTIVEFADYECQYCRQTFASVERLLGEYGDEVRYVYHDFPIEQHRRAVPAAVAARCAREQGKYWDYHENLMVMQGNLSDVDLQRRAEDLGLDMEAFDACYASGRYADELQALLEDGRENGVAYTPTFFINGRMIVGAKPYDELKRIIDEELGAGGGAEAGG